MRVPVLVLVLVLALLTGCGPVVPSVALAPDDDEARLAELEAEVADLQADLDRLLPLVAEQGIAVAECQAELDATQARVGELEAAELPGRVADLEADLAVLWTAVEYLSQGAR